jgi:phage portal protein BeeE
MRRPEARVTRAHTFAWTVDDLVFYGRAHWYIQARRAFDQRPSQFQRLPASEVLIDTEYFINGVPVGDYTLTWQGNILSPDDVVTFWSPIEGLLNVAARSVLTAEKLDQAATRFASSPTAFGWLTATGGEPLSGDELGELALVWAEARDTGAVAALNQDVQWNESTMDPSRLQLVEGRQYQSLELARHINVPPYLVGAPTGSSMVYQNAQQARADLVTFGAAPFLDCIEQTLSSEQVTPRGHVVELSRAAWLNNPMDDRAQPDQSDTPMEQPA